MVPVVHDVHPNTGHADPHQDGAQQIGPARQPQGKDQKVGGQQHAEHDDGFKVEFPVTGFLDFVLPEIVVDPLVQGSEKLG